MITTTLAVLALAGSLSTGAVPATPNWQTDYAQAMTRASAEKKPMAVFIGHGSDAVKRLVADGAVTADSARLLRDSYVCYYLDADTATGKELADRFEMREGLIISGPGGSVQAYRHEGTVTGTDLTRQLTQYATTVQPTTTVTAGVTTSSGTVIPAGYRIVSGGCPNGNCQILVPTSGQYAYPTSSSPFGSSCPNGRCPNQR